MLGTHNFAVADDGVACNSLPANLHTAYVFVDFHLEAKNICLNCRNWNCCGSGCIIIITAIITSNYSVNR